MPAIVIGCDRGMGRWAPDARGGLEEAAAALYGERGFEQTTVAEIATRRASWSECGLPVLRRRA
jgi:hypothetical protein